MVPLEIAPNRFIGSQYPTFIIAEIGQNHQGNIDEAKKLIDAARVSFHFSRVHFKKSFPELFQLLVDVRRRQGSIV